MFEVRFSEDAERHLKRCAARDQRVLLQAIEEQRTHQPTVPTRNRKQLRPNPMATWELRVQDFRVLYNVDEDVVTVLVVAIAVKEGNKFIIEGEERGRGAFAMKTIIIETETRPVAEWLPQEDSDEVVYLTRAGRAKFVLVPLDEGDDEVLAIQKNSRLMAHIAECVARARQGPTKTLAQIKAELELNEAG